MVSCSVEFHLTLALESWSGQEGAVRLQSILHYLSMTQHSPFIHSHFPISGPYEQIVEYSTILL